MKFLQLLCRHTFKTIDTEFLRDTRERFGEILGLPGYKDFRYISEYQRCIRCGKERVIEKKYHLV